MKPILLTVLATVSLSSSFILPISRANACTPHPDDPDGCDNWPPRRVRVEDIKVKKPFPWPVCLSCPPNLKVQDHLILEEHVIQPVIQENTIPQVNENLTEIQGLRR